MKTNRVVLCSLLLAGVMLSPCLAQVVPPIDVGLGNTCTEVSFAGVPNFMNQGLGLEVGVGPTPTCNGRPILAVSGVFYYPRSGASFAGISSSTVLLANWVAVPFDATKNGFGFAVANGQDPVSDGIRPSFMPAFTPVGAASPITTFPLGQELVIFQVVYDAGNGQRATGFCDIVGQPVPEAASLILMGMGLLPVTAILRRARHRIADSVL